MTYCDWCGKSYAATARNRRYCSTICKSRARDLRKRADRQSPRIGVRRNYLARFVPSELNIATDARYGDCDPQWLITRKPDPQANHVPSGRVVTRDYYSTSLELPLCLHCDVPIVGKVQTFNRKVAA